jgi:signal transduction histidine kinase
LFELHGKHPFFHCRSLKVNSIIQTLTQIEGDEKLIMILLSNLLENALKNTPLYRVLASEMKAMVQG